MITATSVSKSFGDIAAVKNITTTIPSGAVYGLIGTNGAGKSTFLRMLAGVLKADDGEIKIDGELVYENPDVKRRCFFISDDQYFFQNTTPTALAAFYKTVYPAFDEARYYKLLKAFGLDPKRRIGTFSKGMKKQVSVISAVSSGADYIFADETFDGLDPVARQAVKSLFAADIADRGITPVVASHNLRELEDICDHIGLLHEGGVLFSCDLEDMRLGLHRVQCAFAAPTPCEAFPEALDITKFESRGSLVTMTVRGDPVTIEAAVRGMESGPLFCELIPLTLEEVFIGETEVVGYDIKSLLF